MKSNAKALIGITVSVVGIFIGWAVYKFYSKKRNAKLADDLQPCADSASGEELLLSCHTTTKLDSCNLHQKDILPSYSDKNKDTKDCDSELAIEENRVAVGSILNTAADEKSTHSCETVVDVLALPSVSDNSKDGNDCDSEFDIKENCIAVESTMLNAGMQEQEFTPSCEVVESLVAKDSASQNASTPSFLELSNDEEDSHNEFNMSYDQLPEVTDSSVNFSHGETSGLPAPLFSEVTLSKPSKGMKAIGDELDNISQSIKGEELDILIDKSKVTENCGSKLILEANSQSDKVSATDSNKSVAAICITPSAHMSGNSVLASKDDMGSLTTKEQQQNLSSEPEQIDSAQNKCIGSSQSECIDFSQNELTQEQHSQETSAACEMSNEEQNRTPCAVISPQIQCATQLPTTKSFEVDGKTAENGNCQIKHAVGDKITTYRFIMPEKMCGYFIGRNGVKIMALKKETNTNIRIGREPVLIHFRYCTIEGCEENVTRALHLIKQRYPHIDITEVNEFGMPQPRNVVISPERMQLHLPFGILIDALVCHIVNAGHVFVQQPTHPSYNSWQRLADCMKIAYSNENVPQLPDNVNEGIICMAPGANSDWCRAQLMSISEDRSTAHVKYVDVGGYANVMLSDLRQIRGDFLTLPFQAVECYMSNIEPADGVTFSEEADAMLNSMTSGHLVQVQCQAVAENAVPFIHIIAQTKKGTVIMVNRELATQGLVKWYN